MLNFTYVIPAQEAQTIVISGWILWFLIAYGVGFIATLLLTIRMPYPFFVIFPFFWPVFIPIYIYLDNQLINDLGIQLFGNNRYDEDLISETLNQYWRYEEQYNIKMALIAKDLGLDKQEVTDQRNFVEWITHRQIVTKTTPTTEKK